MMRNINQYIYRYLPYVLIISVLVFNLGLYFTHSSPLPIDKLFDADSIYLPTLYKDLIVDNGNYSDWYGSAAPYFFPDMFLYFISNFIFSNFYYAIAFYFTIISLLVLLAIYNIYSLFYENKIALYLSSISFSIIYLFPSSVYSMQFPSVFHFGEFVISLFSIYLLLKYLITKKFKKYIVYLLLLTVFTVASDNMYVLHFVVPSLFALLVLWIIKIIPTKKVFLSYFLLISGTILGELLKNFLLINQSVYAETITLSNKYLIKNIQVLIEIFTNSFHTHLFHTIFIFITIVIVVLLFICYRKISILRLKKYKIEILFLFSYFIIMIIGNIFAIVLLYPISPHERYMIPVFLMPIIFMPIIFKWIKFDLLYRKKFLTINFIVTFCLVVFLIYKFYDKFHQTTFKTGYYPELVSCVDNFIEQTGAKDGIASYGESKPLNMLSKNSPNITQYLYDLEECKGVNNAARYKQKYDFAIIKNNSLDKNLILDINGQPTKIFNCQNTEILYYKNKLIVDTSSILPNIQNKLIKFNSSDVIYKGWSQSEKNFRWSLNNNSKILFKIDPDGLIGKLTINFNSLGRQRILIMLNKNKIFKGTVDFHDKKLSLNFKKEILSKNEVNIIEFKFFDAIQPNNKDKRRLALAIKSFIIN